MIYNMNTEVMRVLNSIKALRLRATDYPSSWTQFPAAIYRTSHSPAHVDADQRETQTSWNVTVELYTDSGSLTDLTEELRAGMATIGFFGRTSQSNTASLVRTVCTFSATIDNDTGRVYHN